jgi:hypothetical protein
MESNTKFWRSSENFYSNGSPSEQDDKRRPIGESMTIEVFPKQDTLPNPDSYGNLIRLPFGWHAEAKMRTYVLDREPMENLPPWTLPKLPSVQALDLVLMQLGLQSSD